MLRFAQHRLQIWLDKSRVFRVSSIKMVIKRKMLTMLMHDCTRSRKQVIDCKQLNIYSNTPLSQFEDYASKTLHVMAFQTSQRMLQSLCYRLFCFTQNVFQPMYMHLRDVQLNSHTRSPKLRLITETPIGLHFTAFTVCKNRSEKLFSNTARDDGTTNPHNNSTHRLFIHTGLFDTLVVSEIKSSRR